MYEISNFTRGRILAESARRATTFSERLTGLLGSESLPDGDGLIIDQCNSIHTFFMRFSIDAVFIDSCGVVVRALSSMRPWRLSAVYFRANRVVELPAGKVLETGTVVGDHLQFTPPLEQL